MPGKSFISFITILIGLTLSVSAYSATVPGEVCKQISAPQKIGQVQVSFLGISMYSATLFTQQGNAFAWEKPFALKLQYKRSFSRSRLVKASISELERLEGKREDHAQIAQKLHGCFRSVRKSDRFVAIAKSRNSLHFFFNGRKTCNIQHSGIRERVLGIWLSDRSRNAQLSRKLRGKN